MAELDLKLSRDKVALVKFYTKILIWENKRRLDKLIEFRNLIIEYFNNSRVEWMVAERIEKEAARSARVKINRIINETHSIILLSGINPTIRYTPPPAVGGYIQKIDVIQNIFNLNRFQIGVDPVLDFIDRAIGIYQSNQKSALIRTFNPFFYLGWVLDVISDLPFIAIGKLGFNREKVESSAIGRLVKGIFYLITVIAAFLTTLQLLGFLGPVKQFVHGLLGSSYVN